MTPEQERFESLSIDGEWFHATKELRSYIESISKGDQKL